jgi:hypothetical protein
MFIRNAEEFYISNLAAIEYTNLKYYLNYKRLINKERKEYTEEDVITPLKEENIVYRP